MHVCVIEHYNGLQAKDQLPSRDVKHIRTGFSTLCFFLKVPSLEKKMSESFRLAFTKNICVVVFEAAIKNSSPAFALVLCPALWQKGPPRPSERHIKASQLTGTGSSFWTQRLPVVSLGDGHLFELTHTQGANATLVRPAPLNLFSLPRLVLT